jgi:chemotaxis signal transduction protein
MNERPVPSTPLLQGTHARYLEQLSDQEFWRHAADLATAQSGVTPVTEEYLICPWQLEADYASKQAHNQMPAKVLVSLAHLREIVMAPAHFTYLPASPYWMIGIMAWRGESIAVIDLDAYLSRQQKQLHINKFVLIAQDKDITLGLYTTIASTINAFPPDQVQPLDQQMAQAQSHYADAISGIYADAFVLYLPTLLKTMVKQLRATST